MAYHGETDYKREKYFNHFLIICTKIGLQGSSLWFQVTFYKLRKATIVRNNIGYSKRSFFVLFWCFFHIQEAPRGSSWLTVSPGTQVLVLLLSHLRSVLPPASPLVPVRREQDGEGFAQLSVSLLRSLPKRPVQQPALTSSGTTQSGGPSQLPGASTTVL